MTTCNRMKIVAGGACALALTTSHAEELRVGVDQACPMTGATRVEFVAAPVVLAVAGVVLEKVAGAAIERAAGYLKDDTSITKTGYARVPNLVDSMPVTDRAGRDLMDAKGNKVYAPRMSAAYACVYGVVGNFGTPRDESAGDFTGLGLAMSDKLRALGLQQAPSLYFEGLYEQPKSMPSVYSYTPQYLYYGDHLKSGGLFGEGKRDIGITIELLKPSESSPLSNSVISLEALKPGKGSTLDANYFKGRPLPWQKVPALSENTPITIKVTVLETGKANTLDKALGEALAAKKDDLAQAIANAVAPHGSGSGGK